MKRIGKKDPTIRDVISRLATRLGSDAFHIVDHWNANLCAIGISAPSNHKVLAYIQTFGSAKGRYDAHLELPPKDRRKFPYADAGVHPQVTFAKIVKIVQKHFKKAEAQPDLSAYRRKPPVR